MFLSFNIPLAFNIVVKYPNVWSAHSPVVVEFPLSWSLVSEHVVTELTCETPTKADLRQESNIWEKRVVDGYPYPTHH